jgi:subtilisin family serine protease
MGIIDGRLQKAFQIVREGLAIPIIVQTVAKPTNVDVQELSSYMAVRKVSDISRFVFGTADVNGVHNIANMAFVSTIFYDEPVSRFQYIPQSVSICTRDVHIPVSDSSEFVGATLLHDEGITGKGIKVAVVDTGVNRNHPMLKDAVIKQINIAKENGAEEADINDGNGHGTHVASTVGGRDTVIYSKLLRRELRMHGAAPEVDIIGIKVLDDSGSGQTSWVIEGMEAAVTEKADIISMSLGSLYDGAGLSPDSTVVDDIVFNHGVLCVIAAGNSFVFGSIGSPGGSHGAITVASNAIKTPSAGVVSTFSSKGATTDGRIKPDISAPGGNIVNIKETIYAATSGSLAVEVGDDYAGIMGTSMATPHVSGCLALLLQAGIPRDRYYIEDLLANTAKYGHIKDIYTGYGMIDVFKAYNSFIKNERLLPVSTISRIIDIPLQPIAAILPKSEESAEAHQVRLPYLM